jgi:hypothetical protein
MAALVLGHADKVEAADLLKLPEVRVGSQAHLDMKEGLVQILDRPAAEDTSHRSEAGNHQEDRGTRARRGRPARIPPQAVVMA